MFIERFSTSQQIDQFFLKFYSRTELLPCMRIKMPQAVLSHEKLLVYATVYVIL